MKPKRKTPNRVRGILKAIKGLPKVTAEEAKTRNQAAKVERLRLKAEETQLRIDAPTAEQQAREAEKARLTAQTEVIKEQITERLDAHKAAGKGHGPFVMIKQTATAQVRAAGAEVMEDLGYVVTGRDGRGMPKRERILGRDGEPVRNHVPAAEAPAPVQGGDDPPAPRSDDPRPIWLIEQRQATREEWQAHQQRRQPTSGLAVSPETFYRMSNGAGEHFCGNGTKPAEVSTLWNRSLEGL